MRVTILGSGTAVPVAGRFPSGVLVQAEGQTILVDLGPGVLRRLPDVGVGLEDVDAVLLTHFHVDHCGDLPALLFALNNPRYRGRKPLRVVGGDGLLKVMTGLHVAWERWLEARGYDLSVEQVAPGRLEFGDLLVMAFAIEHTPASLAFRFEDTAGHVAAVSGDATECEGLVDVARGADLFVCESAFPDGEVYGLHLSPRMAGAAAERAGARKLCLTHFYPECDGHDLEGQARSAFSGEIVLATDLAGFDLAT